MTALKEAGVEAVSLVERLREDDEMLRDGLQLPNLTEAWHNVAMKHAAKDCVEAADRIEQLETEVSTLSQVIRDEAKYAKLNIEQLEHQLSVLDEESRLSMQPVAEERARADLAERKLAGVEAERDSWRRVAERCKSEAEGHAQEARTANSTVHEIYQVLSGGKGEPGNWRGAEPARAYVQAAERQLATARTALEPFAHESLFAGPHHEFVSVKRTDCDAAAAAIRSLQSEGGKHG